MNENDLLNSLTLFNFAKNIIEHNSNVYDVYLRAGGMNEFMIEIYKLTNREENVITKITGDQFNELLMLKRAIRLEQERQRDLNFVKDLRSHIDIISKPW
jgi:hypothetical protein